jgi:hypothetical protein
LHKKDAPLRPIVSCQNCVSSGLEEFLYPILKQLLPFAKYSIDSTKSFVERLKKSRDLFDPKTDDLISLDIKDMYNNVNVEKVIDISVTKLYNQRKKFLGKFFEKIPPKAVFEKLLRSTVKSFSKFESKIGFFQQTKGLAMGSKLSPILANLYAAHVENGIVSEKLREGSLKFYSRYVDDSFLIIKKSEKLNFFHKINFRSDSLTYTIENSVNNSLPYLDCTVYFDLETGKIETKHFEKVSKSKVTLNFNAVAPKNQKIAAIHGAIHRAKNSSTNSNNFQKSLVEVAQKYISNGFPAGLVKSKIDNFEKVRATPPVIEKTFYFSATFSNPRAQKVGSKMAKLISSVTPGFKLNLSWRCIRLSSVTLPFLKAKKNSSDPCGVVYLMKCPCGSEYVGETARVFSVRVLEHGRPSVKTAVFNHHQNCTTFQDELKKFAGVRLPKPPDRREYLKTLFSILHKNLFNYWDRILFEGIEIALRKPHLNEQILSKKISFI